MFALAQIAQIASTDAVLAEADSTAQAVEEAVERAVSSHGAEISERLVAIVSVAGFFIALIVLLVGALIVRYLRMQRKARLIELAIQQNQPDVAREIIARDAGRGRWIIAAIVIIVLLAVLKETPIILALVIVAAIFWFMKPERRSDMYRGAADGLGAAKDWLSAKAEPPGNKPGSSDSTGEQK